MTVCIVLSLLLTGAAAYPSNADVVSKLEEIPVFGLRGFLTVGTTVHTG
jgi:hypothetical protein